MPSIFEQIVGALVPGLTRLRADVTALQAQQEQMMAKQEEYDDRMAQFDAGLAEVASDLQKLRDELKVGEPISDANLASLDARIARLNALGVDPPPTA